MDTAKKHEIAALFYEIEEPFAAGLFEEPDRSYFYRYCLGYARYLENLRPAPYEAGDLVYPRARRFWDDTYAMRPQYANTYEVNWELLKQKSAQAYEILRSFSELSLNRPNWPLMRQMHPNINAVLEKYPDIPEYYDGYCHGCPNYKRIVKEGFSSYEKRVQALPEGDFKDGLLALLAAMRTYLSRSAAYLRSAGASKELAAAVEKVPFAPADSYYEGIVAWNLIFYFDGGDNLGYLDDGLADLYAGEDLTEMIRQMFENVDALDAWSCTIGGQYNDITIQALKAIKKRRRPLLELRTNADMPDECWQLAADMIEDGAANPAFYNDTGIHDMLRRLHPQATEEEIRMFVGCGCTETNFQGMTRVGGVDDSVPLLAVFEKYLYENLEQASDFREFYEGYCAEVAARIDAHLDTLVAYYDYKAAYQPNPMRTLLNDDCIEKQKDFNAGGARYTWTLTSISSLVNTIDSLLAVRDVVFEKKQYGAAEFLQKLSAEDPALFKILEKCPCYGVDNEKADAFAADFAERVYRVFHEKPLQSFIDGYMPSEHQFLRYEYHGSKVGPTPDGRRRGMPTADSVSPIRGKAVAGPTAMLCSAAKLPQHLVNGITILNLTLAKNNVQKAIRPLVEGYFAMGGIQAQVTATSVDELKHAMEHPEEHRDLIVRVGGYSDYFINLTPAMRQTVLDRNLHEL